MLLDVAHHQLDLEIVRVLLGDFVQPEKDRLQTRQLRDLVDLLVQALQLSERIQVLRVHDVILH